MMELLEKNFRFIVTWSLLGVIIILLILKENTVTLPAMQPQINPTYNPNFTVNPVVEVIANYSFGNITIAPDRLIIIAQNVTVVQANYTWNATGHVYNIQISEGIGIISEGMGIITSV